MALVGRNTDDLYRLTLTDAGCAEWKRKYQLKSITRR